MGISDGFYYMFELYLELNMPLKKKNNQNKQKLIVIIRLCDGGLTMCESLYSALLRISGVDVTGVGQCVRVCVCLYVCVRTRLFGNPEKFLNSTHFAGPAHELVFQ